MHIPFILMHFTHISVCVLSHFPWFYFSSFFLCVFFLLCNLDIPLPATVDFLWLLKHLQLHAEAGKGQFEMALGHTICTNAADNLIFTREVVRAVARKQGLLATFVPK